MQRFTEPELMEMPAQVKAYARADFSLSDKSFVSALSNFVIKEGVTINENSLIVDLGCGPGNITERISSLWPCSKILGIDGSEEMLSEAKRRQKKMSSNGDLQNISYICSNIASIYEGKFSLKKPADIVVSNSVMHHIHQPELFWKAIRVISRKGSLNFHRDLRRPESKDEVKVLQLKYLPNSPAVLKNDYLASLHAAFKVEEVEKQIDLAGLDSLKVYELEDRYLEVKGII